MENVTENTTHSVEGQTGSADPQANDLQERVSAALEMFGVSAPQESEQDDRDADNDEDLDGAPLIEQQQEPEKKGIKVKFNKEDVFIEEDKIPEYARKGLNYDKIEGRVKEYQTALDRAAKLNGFENHEEFVKSLDKLEEQAKQREQEQFKELRQQLREDAESAGLDPEKVEQFLENHPLMKQAKDAISEREKLQQQSKVEQERSALEKQWEELFTKYPDLAQADDAEWLSADMDARLKRGYSPLDAYELANRDKILEKERETVRQSVLKQQRLNKRSKVEGNVAPEPEDEVPDAVKGAFALFGMDPKTAKKFMTKK